MSVMYWIVANKDGTIFYYPATHFTKAEALADAGEGATYQGADFS